MSYVLSMISAVMLAQQGFAESNLPHLAKQGTAIQLVVDGAPFLMLAGELGNSSASSLEYMKPVWPKLNAMNLNTVLAPVYWELMEPQEGRFDFTLIDGLITEARSQQLRLVLLWFGSWKNSMSCYAPAWVKTDTQRFARARLKNGKAMEIVSAFSDAACQADAKAFAALMRHLKQIDSDKHTVIMVQVENEIGMLEDARDWSDEANQAFAGPVPAEWTDYLNRNKDTLQPQLRECWNAHGNKTSGTWRDLFGDSLQTDELFMAWYYARYTNTVAAAGKAEYPLPMYVNAALNRPNYQPGQYPSAGPLPHLMDVWRAAAPQIDFLSPDIYFADFVNRCTAHHQSGNPLFVPEVQRSPLNGPQAFYVFGFHDALGFSPFSIESASDAEQSAIAKSYDLLSQLMPLVCQHQGQGTMTGVLLDKEHPTQTVEFGSYKLTMSHDYTWNRSGRPEEDQAWPAAGGLVIALGPDEFLAAGTGIIMTFKSIQDKKTVGILAIQEGTFQQGNWVTGRQLNGDEDHQGRHLRIPQGQFGIQKIKLYCYE